MEQARALAKKTFDHLSVSCIPLNAICSERLSCAGKLRVQKQYGKTPTDFRSDTLGRQESNDTSIGSTED
jgi:hypothetical protein